MLVDELCFQVQLSGWAESIIQNKRKTEEIRSVGCLKKDVVASTLEGDFWVTQDMEKWLKAPSKRKGITKLEASRDRFENINDYLFFQESRSMYVFGEQGVHQVNLPFSGGEEYKIIDNGSYTMFITENKDTNVKQNLPFVLDKGLFYIVQNPEEDTPEKFSFSHLSKFDGVYCRKVISARSRFFALMYHLERNMFLLLSSKDGMHWDYIGNILELEDRSRESLYSVDIYSILDTPFIYRKGKNFLYNIDKDDFERIRMTIDDHQASLCNFVRIYGTDICIYEASPRNFYAMENFQKWQPIDMPVDRVISMAKSGDNMLCFGFEKDKRKLFSVQLL